MTITRHIAILRADTMVGSDFIMPNTIKRVIERDFPKAEDVQELARQGGFAVSYATVDFGDREDMSDVIQNRFGEDMAARAVFVDMTTGNIFVTRSGIRYAMDVFVAQEGNIIDAFGVRVDGQVGPANYRFAKGQKISQVAAIRSAMQKMSIGDVKATLEGDAVFSMTIPQLVRTVISAIEMSSTNHKAISARQITDDFGAVKASTIISGIMPA